MVFRQILRQNLLFFKIFVIFLILMVCLGFWLGNKFSICAVIMSLFSLAIHLCNIKTFSQKLEKNKLIFKVAPNMSKILNPIEVITPKRHIFFSKYKVIVYIVLIFWFWIVALVDGIDVGGVLLGGSATSLCSLFYGILKSIKAMKDKS